MMAAFWLNQMLYLPFERRLLDTMLSSPSYTPVGPLSHPFTPAFRHPQATHYPSIFSACNAVHAAAASCY